MADKITNLRTWKNGEVFNARDYVYERNLIVALLNGHEDRIQELESFQQNFDTTYLDKVTTDPQEVAGEVNFTQGIKIQDKQLNWNEVDGALDISLNDDVTLQVGQEQVFYGKADQEDIPNGAPVMFSGVDSVQGNHFVIKNATAQALNEAPELFIGVATQSMLSGDFGYVTEFGFVRNVNLPETYIPAGEENPVSTGYAPGVILWFDSQGTGIGDGFTTTKPDKGYAQIRIAAIVKVNQNQNQENTGMMFVRPSILENAASATGVTLYTSIEEPTDQLEGDVWFDRGGE